MQRSVRPATCHSSHLRALVFNITTSQLTSFAIRQDTSVSTPQVECSLSFSLILFLSPRVFASALRSLIRLAALRPPSCSALHCSRTLFSSLLCSCHCISYHSSRMQHCCRLPFWKNKAYVTLRVTFRFDLNAIGLDRIESNILNTR